MKRNVVAWAALVVSVAALVSSQGLTRQVPAAPELPAEGQKAAQALSLAFEAVADFVKPSVVQISTQRKMGSMNMGRRLPGLPGNPDDPHNNMTPKEFEELFKRFFPDGAPGVRPEKNQFGGQLAQGTGSGFVYDDQGHILTNNHVVENAEKIVVTFYDGTEIPAKVVGTDPEADVAVLKVDTTEYRQVKKGDSAHLKVGELVVAVGAPFGLSQTVTTGIISATERVELGIINAAGGAFEAFIQTDAAINPGNSGGPLVDMNGKVIGINTAIMTGTRSNAGVGFSIPINLASNLADKIIKDGKVNRARLGVAMDNLSPVLAKQLGLDPKTKGIVVTEVVPGSPAAKAGLKEGDILVGFKGEPVLNRGTFRIMVATSDIGKSYELSYLRNGKAAKAEVTLASKDQVVFNVERSQPKPAIAKPEAPKVEAKDFGFEVQPLTPALAKQFGYSADTKGLIVTDVKEGSEAEANGIKAGLLITKAVVNQSLKPLTNLDEFKDLVSKQNEVAFFVQVPGGGGQFVTLAKPKTP